MRILFVMSLLGINLCFSKIFLGWNGAYPAPEFPPPASLPPALPPVSATDISNILGDTVAHTNWVAVAFAADYPARDGNFKFEYVDNNGVGHDMKNFPSSGCAASGFRCGISLGGGTYTLQNPLSVPAYQENAVNSVKSLAATYNAAFLELNFEGFAMTEANFADLWCPILTLLKSSTSLQVVISPYGDAVYGSRRFHRALYSKCPSKIDFTAFQCYASTTDQVECTNNAVSDFGGRIEKMLIGLCANPNDYRGTRSVSEAVNIVKQLPQAAGVAMWSYELSKYATPPFDMVKQVATAMKICPRPSGWCTHLGSQTMLLDCDGDGKLDPVCSDTTGAFGVLQSRYNCADSWPGGAGATCRGCARPSSQWCIHPGSQYSLSDCDGDGKLDPVCSDTTGALGVVQSRYNCADSWPVGAGATCRGCARPSQWCNNAGSQYSLWDCDGDGKLDPVCSDTTGAFGVLQSRRDCADSWPGGAGAACHPISSSSSSSNTCVDGNMLMNTLNHGSVAVKNITKDMVVQGIRNGEHVWCAVTSNSPLGRGPLVGDFTSNHLVLQNGILQESGNLGIRLVGDLYNLASDCEFTTNSQGVSFTPFASDNSRWHSRLSLSQYYEFFQALMAINSHLSIDIFDLSQLTGSYKTKGDRLCNALVDCLFENRNCVQLNAYVDDFIKNNMKTDAQKAFKKVYKNGAAVTHTAKTKRLL